jgi:uncharacterized protein (TIGR02246 family)
MLLLVEGCQRTQQVAPRSHEADISSLREVEIAEEQAWTSKDLEKAVSFYADDATYMYPNAPAIVGKDGIRAYIKPIFADPAYSCQTQIAKVDVAQSGDLGYTQGTYNNCIWTNPSNGKTMNDRGKWLNVRKKQSDGSWKIVQDTFSSDLPLSNSGK